MKLKLEPLPAPARELQSKHCEPTYFRDETAIASGCFAHDPEMMIETKLNGNIAATARAKTCDDAPA